jgi:hypothetical protein
VKIQKKLQTYFLFKKDRITYTQILNFDECEKREKKISILSKRYILKEEKKERKYEREREIEMRKKMKRKEKRKADRLIEIDKRERETEMRK